MVINTKTKFDLHLEGVSQSHLKIEKKIQIMIKNRGKDDCEVQIPQRYCRTTEIKSRPSLLKVIGGTLIFPKNRHHPWDEAEGFALCGVRIICGFPPTAQGIWGLLTVHNCCLLGFPVTCTGRLHPFCSFACWFWPQPPINPHPSKKILKTSG